MGATTTSTLPGDVVLSPERLRALAQTGLWQSGPEESFDRLTRVAAKVLGVPVSLVTLVGSESQYLKSSAAPAGEFPQGDEAPLSHSFCRHIVGSGGMLIVEDASCHPLVRDSPAIAEYDVNAYLGVPLRAGDHVIGAFCVLDSTPRAWSAADVETLADIAAGVQAAIDYRLETIALHERTALLHAASAKLQLFASQLPAVGWTTDADLRITSAHGSTLPTFGVADNGVGRTIQEIVGGDEGHPAVAAHLEALAGRTGSYRRRLGDRDYDVVVEPLREDGLVVGTIALAADVTEQLDSERRHVERETFLETIFASAPQSLTVVNRAGELIEANAAAATVAETGSREELLGRNVIDFVHPADRARVEEQHLRSLSGEQLCFTFRAAGLDGTTRTLRSHLTPLHADDGSVEAVLAISDDVTILEQLDATLDVHRDVVSSLDVGVYVLELDDPADASTFRIVEANAGSERASGVAPETVLGRLVAESFPTLATPAVLDAFRAIADDGDAVAFGDVEAEGRIFDVRGVPLPGPRMALTFANVTEQRRLESRARQSQKMEAVGQLAGGVAHDFNNLLTAITGYTTLAREQVAGDSALQADLDEVLRAADRARDLTRQLLAFGRQQLLRPTPLDLNEVVAGSERLLERVLGEDVLIESRLGNVPTVLADRGQVEQVLVNLAVNGRDAMPNGGTLVLSTGAELVTAAHHDVPDGTAPGLYATISVADSGTGMTPEVREKIFEPFFTTKDFGEGHGLGLSTVHGIVQQSGGQIAVATSEGRGTTFTVYLPAVGDASPAEDAASQPAPARRGSERIVVVEDEELVRNLTVRTLEAHGYDVVAFADPAEALADLPDDFALLVTDVVMPKLNGRELAEKVLRLVPTARVIFVSGYAPDEVLARGISEDAVEFLQKPFSMSDLARKVRSVLDEDGRAWDGFIRGTDRRPGHAAHVYGDVSELADAAGRYLSLGFDLGQPGVVIAVGRHWEMLSARLEQAGWSAERLERTGLLTLLDAEETLARIAPSGRISRALFEAIVGETVRDVAGRFPGRTVRAFGEMVDVLCARGDVGSAIELETFWNALCSEVQLSLLCGYGVDVFDPDAQTTILAEICRAHSHVLPARDTALLTEAVDRALAETLGGDAARVHSLAERDGRGSLPHAQRVMLWLSSEMPEVAGIVLATARDHYRRAGG